MPNLVSLWTSWSLNFKQCRQIKKILNFLLGQKKSTKLIPAWLYHETYFHDNQRLFLVTWLGAMESPGNAHNPITLNNNNVSPDVTTVQSLVSFWDVPANKHALPNYSFCQIPTHVAEFGSLCHNLTHKPSGVYDGKLSAINLLWLVNQSRTEQPDGNWHYPRWQQTGAALAPHIRCICSATA